MKRLSRDISRCLGHEGGRKVCPDRDQCARFMTMQADNLAGPHAGHPHSYIASLRDEDGVCRKRIEVGA